MQVKNVECQIAQAQLRRYLVGEEMPRAVVGDLEAHLKGCADCMAAAQLERQSLASVLTNNITSKSRSLATSDEPAPQSPIQFATKLAPKRLQPGKAAIQAPVDILDTPDEQYAPKPKKKSINFKTVACSIGLALILVLISTVIKDPTAIFGPRASEPNTDTPQAGSDAGQRTLTDSNSGAPARSMPTAPKPPETPAATIHSDLPGKPMLGNAIIIADTEKGTKVAQVPNKGSGEPGNGTLKVYPPEKS